MRIKRFNGGNEKSFSSIDTEKQKEFGLFGHSKMDLIDYFDMVEKIDYPNKSKSIKQDSMNDYDETWDYIYNGKLSNQQDKNLRNILNNPKKYLIDYITNHKNIPGTYSNWKLISSYIDKSGIHFVMECSKPVGNIRVGNVIDYHFNLDKPEI